MHAGPRSGRSLRSCAILGALVACLLIPPGARAGEGAGDWRHTLVIYGMGAAIDGSAQIGQVEVPIDVSISDVFDALEVGAMATYRVENDTWSFTVDTTFTGLGGSDTTEGGLLRGELDVDQFTFMGTAGRKLTDNLEFLFGFAYMNLSTDLKLNGTAGEVVDLQASADVDWIDPTVGLQYNVPFGEDWRLNLRGDIGGFGIGSELMYQLLATFRWQMSDTAGIVFGYRVIDFDYEEGQGRNYQHYDLTEQGPVVGVVISF
jgi:hypothetical protein